jgi:hypothetical protein
VNPRRFTAITLLAGLVAVAGVFALLVWNAPAESPGYGKAVAIVWPILSLLAFGLLWAPALWIMHLVARRSGPMERGIREFTFVTLALATGLFAYSAYRVYPSARDGLRKRQLLKVATATPVDETAALSLVDEYLRVSLGGVRFDDYPQAAFIALLRNPTTPATVLEKIGRELRVESSWWDLLAHNPSLPESVIAARINDHNLAWKFGQNPKLPEKYLRQLAESTDFSCKAAAARNTSTPRDCLEKLTHDKDSLVRDFARQNLAGTLGPFAYR